MCGRGEILCHLVIRHERRLSLFPSQRPRRAARGKCETRQEDPALRCVLAWRLQCRQLGNLFGACLTASMTAHCSSYRRQSVIMWRCAVHALHGRGDRAHHAGRTVESSVGSNAARKVSGRAVCARHGEPTPSRGSVAQRCRGASLPQLPSRLWPTTLLVRFLLFLPHLRACSSIKTTHTASGHARGRSQPSYGG